MFQVNMFEPQPVEVQAVQDKDLIILLDLNYTLVGNSWEKRSQKSMSYAAKIRLETYRQWLVELVRGHTVLLCTVRWEGYQDETLANIERLTGWLPEGAYFNPENGEYRGQIVKEKYLLGGIFETYGLPAERRYFAVESATQTKLMYARHGIQAASVGKDVWASLPIR